MCIVRALEMSALRDGVCFERLLLLRRNEEDYDAAECRELMKCDFDAYCARSDFHVHKLRSD